MAWAGTLEHCRTISNPMHFPMNSEGVQLHLPEVNENFLSVYMCMHTTYIHIYSKLKSLSLAMGLEQSVKGFHLFFLASTCCKHRFLSSMQ